MFLYETLVRDRMREGQIRAREQRLARRLAAARRWHRLARYADRRAHRAASCAGGLGALQGLPTGHR